jgi:hypothetical protein
MGTHRCPCVLLFAEHVACGNPLFSNLAQMETEHDELTRVRSAHADTAMRTMGAHWTLPTSLMQAHVGYDKHSKNQLIPLHSHEEVTHLKVFPVPIPSYISITGGDRDTARCSI